MRPKWQGLASSLGAAGLLHRGVPDGPCNHEAAKYRERPTSGHEKAAERNALGRLFGDRGPVSSTDLFAEFHGTPLWGLRTSPVRFWPPE
jgi:hypothetical protein